MSITEDHKELEVYEIGYSILPSVPEDNLSNVVATIKSAVTKEGGVELDSEDPLKMPLAYEMSKTIGARKYVASEAFVGWVKFEVEPSSINAIKEGVEKIEEILRILLIKVPRETTFTFESARKALEDAEIEKEEARAEAEAPKAPEEAEPAAPEAVVE